MLGRKPKQQPKEQIRFKSYADSSYNSYEDEVEAGGSGLVGKVKESVMKLTTTVKEQTPKVINLVKNDTPKLVKAAKDNNNQLAKLAKERYKLTIGLGVLLLVAGSYITLAQSLKVADSDAETSSTAEVLSEQTVVNEQPVFDAVVPVATDINQARVDEEKGTYTFQDLLAGALITVSQQPLPEDVKNEADGIKKLASSLLNVVSIDQLNTQNGAMYLAKLESGGQRAVLSHGELLIFIESSEIIPITPWIDYVNQLGEAQG